MVLSPGVPVTGVSAFATLHSPSVGMVVPVSVAVTVASVTTSAGGIAGCSLGSGAACLVVR